MVPGKQTLEETKEDRCLQPTCTGLRTLERTGNRSSIMQNIGDRDPNRESDAWAR